MCIWMCQHCLTQRHSSPEADRQGVSFTPFQYKQHNKKLKSAIESKSLPKIPTSASGSEWPQIILDQIYPADYSQLTQSPFSTPLGVNSTSQKPYSSSQNLPSQALGIIISAILSLRYNIPHRASRILNPSLKLLIKSSISSSGGHPTPPFHIPQDISTIFEHLQLEPLIENYTFCPQCFFLNGLTESVTTDQPHFQCHNKPNEHYPPCTQSLGKFINLFEPYTQNTTNIKQNFIPTKHFIYQPLKNWLSRFLQWAGIMEILHQHQQSQIPEASPNCDIWDGLFWRRFTGTRTINDSPFMSIWGALAFPIYVDWFNAHGKSTLLASIGPIMLIFLNLPPSKILKQENVYVAGSIPGPKEPTALQLNYLLIPLIKELKELWQGYHFHPPQWDLQDPLSVFPSSQPFPIWWPCTSLLDLLLTQETPLVIFALFTRLKLKKLLLNFTTHAHTQIINQPLQNAFGHPHNKDKQSYLSMECNIQFWKTFHIGMQPEWLILT
ncbi:hypothetical protein O181_115483 [Austropuccinia psidii MF-1]|uniref:Uncharacterized protein n=1 Tax=Austropuccinia psidii MF-1 TaxID=1389203 RepID=A0A9Q3K6I9_9BASI|nr:hypothetical protein [Austropuccinia psidii MF-1]